MVMDPFKKPKIGPEDSANLSEQESEVRDLFDVSDVSDASVDSATEGIVEKVSELARERPGENQSGARCNVQTTQQDQRKTEADFGDRMALRERLLKNAPKPAEMRSQVRKILLKEQNKLEAEFRKYSRKKNYHLLGIAIMKLRGVVKQISEVAHASYDLLKEIWLRVVHHFA